MIDHILVPSERVDLVTECKGLGDDALNVYIIDLFIAA